MTATLFDMLRNCVARHPEKTAIVHGSTRMSYATLYEKTLSAAGFLQNAGLRKGDRIGLLLNKSPDAIVAFLGGALAGGVVFPVDSKQLTAHIRHLIRLTSPAALIVSETYQSLLAELAPPCPKERALMIPETEGAGRSPWRRIMAGDFAAAAAIRIRGEDTAYLNLTSGTTGMPKCAKTTHDNIYWNTRAAVESLGLTADDVHLCMFPVFVHPHELFARSLYLGGTMVLNDRIAPKAIVKAVSENKVTCMMAIASIYEALVRYCENASVSLPSLRLPESGGMHLNPELARRFHDVFRIRVTPVWGSTEAAGVALAFPPGEPFRPGSMGRPCPYYDIRVLDESGAETGPGEVGEMIIRGAAVCAEYFGNPQKTAENMRDGWFYTGDFVKRDADGFFYFVGRKTGMMKVAGLKVFPTEIEDVLIMHPGVAEAAVVKVQDGLHGEAPKAVIVPEKDAVLDRKMIRNFCEERLSRYKVPRIIEFRASLPKTPGGKIRMNALQGP